VRLNHLADQDAPCRALTDAERDLRCAGNDGSDAPKLLTNLRRLRDLLRAESLLTSPLELGEVSRAIGDFEEAAWQLAQCQPEDAQDAP
jgi:hypothetical protein